jgi:hypothetical protein
MVGFPDTVRNKMATPSTYAEYKAKENRAAASKLSCLRLAVPSTPKELLQVFFYARYHGRSKADIMKMLNLAYQEVAE